jgi:hypothetical protein
MQIIGFPKLIPVLELEKDTATSSTPSIILVGGTKKPKSPAKCTKKTPGYPNC